MCASSTPRTSRSVYGRAPTAIVGFVVLRILIDTAGDPTSHNLWPFEILIFGTGALVIIGVLKMARRLMGVVS
ncbi:MAG: hypothetical protein ACHBNF_12780 [Chromatiales bacterium]